MSRHHNRWRFVAGLRTNSFKARVLGRHNKGTATVVRAAPAVRALASDQPCDRRCRRGRRVACHRGYSVEVPIGRVRFGRSRMRLLFITSTRVGDAVLSTGILAHCIQRHPGIAVTIACGAPAAPLFAAVPNLDELIILKKMRYARHWLTLWARCVGRCWDLLIDLRSAPITLLLAAKRRWRIGRPDDSVHRVVRLAQVLGLEDNPPAPHLWIGEAERRAALRLVPEGPPVVAVGPTANWVGKTWRPEYFAELIRRLTGPGGILPGARVAVCGHRSERQAALPVLEAVPGQRRIDLVGSAGLLEIFACLQRTALYIGNDSGLMHLAAAAGVPTLGLFGPSREELYAPWGPLTAAVRPPIPYEEIFPPGFDHRNTGTLMDGLTVDRVEAAALALWRRVQAA